MSPYDFVSKYDRHLKCAIHALGSTCGVLENQNVFVLYFEESDRMLRLDDQEKLPSTAVDVGKLVCYINKASAMLSHSRYREECEAAGIEPASVLLVEVSAEGWAKSVRIVSAQKLSGGFKWESGTR